MRCNKRCRGLGTWFVSGLLLGGCGSAHVDRDSAVDVAETSDGAEIADALAPDAALDASPTDGTDDAADVVRSHDPDCAISLTQNGVPWDGTPLTIGEGSRAQLELAPGSSVRSITVAPADASVRARLDANNTRLVIKPGYGTANVRSSASLTLSCADGIATRDVPFIVHGLAWSATPMWMPGTNGPIAREYGSMWIDEADPDRLLFYGGFHYVPTQFTASTDFWALDLVTGVWESLTPTGDVPALGGGRMAPIPGARANLYFGGGARASDGSLNIPNSLVRLDYAPDRLVFTNVAATPDLTYGEFLHAFVFDAPRNQYVSACGANDTMGYHCNARTLNAATHAWSALHPDGLDAPAGRDGMYFTYDAENERLVIFGGDAGADPSGCNCLNDTWVLELGSGTPTWVRLDAGDAGPARRNGAYALDPVGHRLIAWGGTADGLTPVPGVYALDLDRGEEHWTAIDIPNAPPARASAMAVYDAPRHRILAGFGNADQLYTDLWALDLGSP